MCGRRQDRLQPDAHHSFQCIAAGAGALGAPSVHKCTAKMHVGRKSREVTDEGIGLITVSERGTL